MNGRLPQIILAKALNLPIDDITSETSIENCNSWDSIAHLRVVLEIESTIGRELSAEEVFAATDCEGVKKLL